MAAFGVLLFLVAVSGALAFQDASRFAFPEDVQGLSGARIVSGWEAEEGQIPYQLSLRMVSPIGGVTACGATIIHHEWALTAAHCTASRVTVVIRAGVTNLTRPWAIFESTEYYNHPLYNEALQSFVQPHDIGLIKFNRVIEYNDVIQPVRMQNSLNKNRNYEGTQLMASGWGRTWTNGASSEIMNWVYLTGEANERCRALYGGSSIIIDSTICAGAYNVSSQSTCQGDSGGPLVVVDDDGQVTQVGISSFVSSTGCHTDFPAGFIRPGHYHDWYLEVTGIDFDWVPAEPTPTPESEEEVDPTTAAPEESEEATTVAPESEEEVDPTTTAPEDSEEATTVAPESEEEVDPTTTAPEDSEEATTVAPESEEEVDPTTTAPEDSEEATTVAPESEEEIDPTTTAPEDSEEATTVAPESEEEVDPTTAAPEESEEATTVAPESEEEVDPTTTAPEESEEATTVAPESEESKSSESKSSESRSSESKSSESKSSESKSSESKSSESKSSESKSSESKSSESKSSESKSEESNENGET